MIAVEWLGKALVLGGLLAIASTQITAAVLVASHSIGNALLAFTLPGFILVAPTLRHHPNYGKLIGIWVGGLLGIAAGTVLLA